MVIIITVANDTVVETALIRGVDPIPDCYHVYEDYRKEAEVPTRGSIYKPVVDDKCVFQQQ